MKLGHVQRGKLLLGPVLSVIRKIPNSLTHLHSVRARGIRGYRNKGPPRLPQELFDIVIGQLFNDRPTLLSCALVNYAWMCLARRYIFYRIRLNLVHIVHEVDKPIRWRSHLDKIVGLGEEVTNLVKEVYFTAPRDISTTGRLTKPALITVFESLPKLHTLIFDALILDYKDFERATNQAAPLSSSLRRLIIHDACCTSDQLIAFFELFPSIHDLRLLEWGIKLLGPRFFGTPFTTPFTRLPLETLSLEGFRWNYLLSPNEKHGWSSLRRLHIDLRWLYCYTLTRVQWIMSHASDSLRHLHFVLGDRESLPCDFQHVHLDIPSKLSSVSFQVLSLHKNPTIRYLYPDHTWRRFSAMQWDIVLRMLQLIHPPPLRRIEIQIIYSDCDPRGLLGEITSTWAGIEETLMRWENLEQVVFSGNSNLELAMESNLRLPLPEIWRTFLRSKLSAISERICFLQEPRDICGIDYLDESI